MTRAAFRRRMGVLAIGLGLMGALQAQACCRRSAEPGHDQTYLALVPLSSRDTPQRAVGEGEHTYRFVVRDANHPERPWRRAPYQVSTREGVKWEGGPDAHQGVTDAKGRTALFRSKTPVAPEDWMVLPLLGQGPQGMTFRLVDHRDQGVGDHPYLIDAEGGGIFCGRSLPGGHTARVLDRRETTMRLHTEFDDDACRQLAAALNPVMAERDPKRRIKQLQALLRQGWWRPSRERIEGKLMEALLAHGGEDEIRAAVSRWMAEPGVSRQALAERLNSVGYGLLEQQPPRLTSLAESLLAQGVALSPTPAILDSHAWALHTLGRHEAALVGLEQALDGFERSCTAEHEAMYQETLAHRAEVLAALGRDDAALDAWVRVHRLNPQATWAASLQRWSAVSAAVKREAERREQAGEPAPLGCADTRDRRFLATELAMPPASP